MLISLLGGQYRITKALGQGGFGKTYLAEDTRRRNSQCVVKQFAPDPGMKSNPGALQKATELFNQEAERLLQLEEHPQIPTLYAHFEENLPQAGNNGEIPLQYLVQQYIKGQTLQQELKAGPFSETKIRELLQDLLPVLDFIHQHKVIHRDIKPENIIRRDSDKKLVLIDFGVAKGNTKTLLTRQGTSVGTAGYAPLEQMMQGIAYPASDLYSLAVACIRLLTGCVPNADSSDKLFNALEGCWVWRQNLPEGSNVSSELGEILDKLLETIAKNRYQSATEVLKALNSSTTGGSQGVSSSTPPLSKGGQGGLTLPTFQFTTVTVNSWGQITSRTDKEAKYYRQNQGNGIFIDMVAIPGGKFQMGEDSGQHQVTVPSFYLAKYPITQAQYQAIMGQNPSGFKGSDLPVDTVNWNDAVEFCQKLTQKTGQAYRLPSEAEWEYACRAGTTTPFHFGDTITTDLANYGNNRKQTTPVGTFPPNPWGLYDMHGNVWEWCQDVWHNNYNVAPTDGSAWETGGESNRRVLRGGSWGNDPRYCRSGQRRRRDLDFRINLFGFRVAVSRLPVSGS